MLFATVRELQETVFSVMIIRLFGTAEELNAVQAFIADAGVSVERISLSELQEVNTYDTKISGHYA
ncbi:MAG TPA: NIL domain-containing protein [Clostridia bacterium]|nr:NIL domain-containing protein [Clostridia bacterium]